MQKITILERDYKSAKEYLELALDLVRETLQRRIDNETRTTYNDYERQILAELQRLKQVLKEEREKLSVEMAEAISQL